MHREPTELLGGQDHGAAIDATPSGVARVVGSRMYAGRGWRAIASIAADCHCVRAGGWSMLRAVTASSGVVAVVAWRHARTNAPLVQAWRELGIRAALLDPPRAHEILGPGDVALARADVSTLA